MQIKAKVRLEFKLHDQFKPEGLFKKDRTWQVLIKIEIETTTENNLSAPQKLNVELPHDL